VAGVLTSQAEDGPQANVAARRPESSASARSEPQASLAARRPEFWRPGRLVVRRQFHRGEVLGRAWLGRVVADDERGLWLWIADGSPFADVRAADGRAFREVPFGEWGDTPQTLEERRWASDVLMFHPTAGEYSASASARTESQASSAARRTEYSVWFFFWPDGTFRDWYVNLEQTGVRWDDATADGSVTPSAAEVLAGIDTVDYDLDIVAEPDRTWRWKDVEEFNHHLSHPKVYWCDDAEAVWEQGHRVVELIEAGVFPFDGTYTDYRPDPGWALSEALPAGYDRRPRAYSAPTEVGPARRSGPAGAIG
jgi:hypothetical protein